MRTCDDYQLDLERRRRGELSGEELEAAEGHLARCARCQEAEGLARSVDALLSAQARSAEARVDWGRMRRTIERELRAYRALPWVLLATFVLIGFGAGAAFSGERWLEMGLRVSAMGVVFAAGGALYVRRALRAAAAAVRSGGEELLAYRRRELDGQIREARQLWLLGPGMAIPSAVGAVLAWDNDHHAGPALLVVAVLLAAATVRTLWFELPRLRRERAALS